MNLLPFENIEVQSPLSQDEIENTIKNNIAWTTQLGLSYTRGSSREYEGYIDNGSFKIRRILRSGRNSFIPIVSGTIEESTDRGSKVKLKLRLHIMVMIIIGIITLFAGIQVIAPLLSNPVTKEERKEYLMEQSPIDEELAELIVSNMEEKSIASRINWFGLLLFFAPYTLATLFYNHEASIVKDKMRSMLKA